jgi:hypothetical protein
VYKQIIILLGIFITASLACAAPAHPLDYYLRDGRIQDGLDAFASPKNDKEKFSLAVLQALDGLQQFSAGSCHLGVRHDFINGSLPFFRVMMPGPGGVQSSNEVATPEKVAALFDNLRVSLKQANQTLAGIDYKEFMVEVNLSKIRADLNGDGIVAPDEFVMTKLAPALGIAQPSTNTPDVIIHFDSADAAWLKGYTHLLTGLLDVLESYDWRPVWNQCADIVFQNPNPAPPLSRFTRTEQGEMFSRWADLIAALHDMRLEVVDPDGLAKAQKEFLAMIGCSRTCWQRVLAEKDDDHEWLPSPSQTGPGGSKVTQAQIDGWMRIMDESEAVLLGKKLLPHWRLKPGVGISVPKLVASPPRLDLVLMIQGSAFVPYLEEGSVSDQSTWRELLQPYGPGFARFALWSQ